MTYLNIIQRPRRWDKPFCEYMSDELIDRILSGPHFQNMDESSFPRTLNLRDIIRNDCRLRRYKKNQLILNAGAYINSAFLVLSGGATLVLEPGIDPAAWGRVKTARPSVLASLRKLFEKSRFPEVRVFASGVKNRFNRNTTRRGAITIANLDELVGKAGAETVPLNVGDVFGESAVLGRTEMTNTVVSKEPTHVLEIRWQGLRDICKYAPKFKSMIERCYRERGLYEQLLSVPLFKHISKDKIRALADVAQYEVYGEFAWQRKFQQASKAAEITADYDRLIEAEPVIAKAGEYPDGLYLIRNGFARVSRRINHGHYTLGHLAAGGLFGLQELFDGWTNSERQRLRCSLRALGYADVIRIPTEWVEENVFAAYLNDAVQTELHHQLEALPVDVRQLGARSSQVDRKFTEFLVENRYVNGAQTMMIDLERCVRCDDCVTACANAHDNNPRFVRHGPTFGRYMIANACMHCNDPVCMIGCPTGAIHRSENGVVSINDETCIGCSTCANSCPYDNIRMVPIRDPEGKLYTDEQSIPIVKATKCDLCSTLPGEPACVRACSHDALTRIDVKDVGKLADWVDR